MATTTNFGWETPDDTDLVKDGALAMRTLGNSIDSSFVDLKGGTTGQVLAKASNTDLDFTWTNGGDITEVAAGIGISGGGTSGSVTITNSMATAIDAKGDLVAGTGADAFARLAVGANNTVLTADSTTATGLKWATPNGYTQLATGSLTGSSITISSISSEYRDLVLVFRSPIPATDSANSVLVQVNADNNSNRHTTVAPGNGNNQSFNNNYWLVTTPADNAVGNGLTVVNIFDYANTTTWKTAFSNSVTANQTTTTNFNYHNQFHIYNQTNAISSLVFVPGTGNWNSGTYVVFGVK